MPFATHDDGFGDQGIPRLGQGRRRRRARASDRWMPHGDGTGSDPQGGADRPPVARRPSAGAAPQLARHLGLSTPSACCAKPGSTRSSASSMLELVAPEAAAGGGGSDQPPATTGRALTPLPGDGVKLPQTIKPIQVPSTEQRAEVNHAAEILKMQQDIARAPQAKAGSCWRRGCSSSSVCRRCWRPGISPWSRHRSMRTKSEFQIQQADPPAAAGHGRAVVRHLHGHLAGFASPCRAICNRARRCCGWTTIWAFAPISRPTHIDPIQRLDDDATLEAAYKLYTKIRPDLL